MGSKGTKAEHIFGPMSSPYAGSKNANSRLTEDEVREIRRLAGTLTRKALARLFQVHPCTVQNIISRRSWKHI